MKKKLAVLVLALAALFGAAASSKAQGSALQENASNRIVIVRNWYYRTYSVAPVYVYRPRYFVAAPVVTYSAPVYRFHFYHYYWWRY
jgi:hypothetical protein